MRAWNRHPEARGVLHETSLVRDDLEGVERRDGQGGMRREPVLQRADRVRRDVGDRQQHVHVLARDEIEQEPLEGFAVGVRRWIRDPARAVPGRGRQADRLFVAHDHGRAAPPEGPDDRERRALIAVGDEDGHRHAASTFVAIRLS